jgi:hypothetical protein
MLFKNYSQLVYKIGSKEITLLDIFRSVSFVDVDTSKAFNDYYIQDGETPESVALKLYGTANLSWLIMMVNAYSSIKNDWFTSQTEYERLFTQNFGGDAFYISSLPDIQAGDILVKVTGVTGASLESASSINTDVYRYVSSFDPYFRKVRGICGSGSFTAGDKILFARRNAQTNSPEPLVFSSKDSIPKQTDYSELIYAEKYEKSVSYFYTTSNVVIDPYRYSISGSTAIDSRTIYLNTGDTLSADNFARCILYKYGACGGVVNGLLKKSVGEEEFNKYTKKQKIKVLKQEYVQTVVSVIESAIQSNEIGKVIRIRTDV